MTNYCLIGAGSMGSNHLRVMHNMGLSIKAIVEPQPRDDFPAALKDRLISSTDDLPTDIDAAVIAVPTALHADITQQIVDAGVKKIFIEKPAFIEPQPYLQAGIDLIVGYIELFNPAFDCVRQVLSENRLGKIKRISSSRLGGPPRDHKKAKSVIWDLAVHDIRFIEALLGSAVNFDHCAVRRDQGVVSSALISASLGDIIISFDASWDVANKKRTLEIFGENGYVHVDLAQQEAFMRHNEFTREGNLDFLGNMMWSTFAEEVKFGIVKEEPLKREIAFFDECCRTGEFPVYDVSFNARIEALTHV
ncbi:MAG: Gfo/Idh/MocA family oxidoreductase [Alphaproteobacteria bacterium]|nr:Gfo/Idh/MocA family oxidoreductase [Alphaproteobacteria bacterium]